MNGLQKGIRIMKDILMQILAFGLIALVSCKTGEEQLSLEKQELGRDAVIMKNEKHKIHQRKSLGSKKNF